MYDKARILLCISIAESYKLITKSSFLILGAFDATESS